MESLQGNFLIATNKMADPRFQEQVILICSHSEDGALGLTVNRPTSHSLDEVFKSANMSVNIDAFPPIYLGGPVEQESAFFLYSSDYEAQEYVAVTPEINMSREAGILKDIGLGRGPRDFLFILGYAGWASGQLEAELALNGWLTLPASYPILFNTADEQKWRAAALKDGIEISLYNDEIGFA